MSKVNSKIRKYTLIYVLALIGYAILLFTFMVRVENVGAQFATFLIGGFFTIPIYVVFLNKITSLKCPKCSKPVLTKPPSFFDFLLLTKAYEKCYFCKSTFE